MLMLDHEMMLVCEGHSASVVCAPARGSRGIPPKCVKTDLKSFQQAVSMNLIFI